MLNLPRILNSRYVMDALPPGLSNQEPAMVSYTYTKTIASRMFNQKRVVEELNVDKGTEAMYCDCNGSKHCYEPAEHVVTGIIRDASLRSLIEKGPSYREQNYVNWKKICREAKYKRKWSSREGKYLMNGKGKKNLFPHKKDINRRKQHVLKSRKLFKRAS